MKIAIGYDPNAADMIPMIKSLCEEMGHEAFIYGGFDPVYANTAFAVGKAVASGKYDRGILVCGTGLGMSIAANKVEGVYAALLTDIYSARRAILSNDSNVACIGAFTTGEKLAEAPLREWLSLRYVSGTPSEVKVLRYKEYDRTRRA